MTRSEHEGAQSEDESVETEREEGVAEIGDVKGEGDDKGRASRTKVIALKRRKRRARFMWMKKAGHETNAARRGSVHFGWIAFGCQDVACLAGQGTGEAAA
jgi:hypothetical protein